MAFYDRTETGAYLCDEGFLVMQILIAFSVICERAVIRKTTEETTCVAIHSPPALLKVPACPSAYYITTHGIHFLHNINISEYGYIGSIVIFNIV